MLPYHRGKQIQSLLRSIIASLTLTAARCFPPGVPRAGPAAPELEKLKVPCLCPAVRPQRALPAGVGERGEGHPQGVLGEVFSNAYRSGTFGIKASCFCAPIFFSAQLSWAPSTPTRPRASCCWTRKSNPQHQNPGRVQTSGVVLCRRGFTGAAGTDQSHSS